MYEHPPHFPGYRPYTVKSKAIALLLSFLVPGTGYLYLGLMKRGLSIMAAFFLNIAAIPMVVLTFEHQKTSSDAIMIPLIICLSFFLVIQYVHNIFDTMHKTDELNLRLMANDPYAYAVIDELPIKPKTAGVVLVGFGALLFLFEWFPQSLFSFLFQYGGSVIGMLMIVGGGFLIYRMK